jgi:hypothetical protein
LANAGSKYHDKQTSGDACLRKYFSVSGNVVDTQSMPKKKKFAKCPCCEMERYSTEVTVCLSIFEKYEQRQYKYYKELDIDSYDTLTENDFEWACDECLDKNRAILANPLIQESAFSVNLAYCDQNFTCRKCGLDFLFAKEEKRKWYETYKFRPDSAPVHCLTCRRAIRELMAENKLLSDILAMEKSAVTISQWQTVVEIYKKWGKVEKTKFYQKVIKKLNN